VVCPAHGYRFDLGTGACLTDPQLKLKTYRLVPDGAGFTVQE
jgi:nitrite reductase/ring-hydroxylating ferredoxin subunit